MTLTKNARRIITGAIAATALPVAAIAGAGSAHATTASGCTISPYTPIYSYTNTAGVKVLDYKISVNCSSGRHAHITQERGEEDPWPNGDDKVGTSTFTASGVTTLHNYRTLVDGEPGQEEMYQRIKFWVHSDNGVVSATTGWQNSGVRAFFN